MRMCLKHRQGRFPESHWVLWTFEIKGSIGESVGNNGQEHESLIWIYKAILHEFRNLSLTPNLADGEVLSF